MRRFALSLSIAVATGSLAFLFPSNSTRAETYAGSPVGFVNLPISPSPDGTTFSLTPISIPLLFPSEIDGEASGTISAVTASTLSSGDANWTDGALSQAASPYYVHVKTGAAAGRAFRITANDSETLTLDTEGVDLTTLGITSDTDAYAVIDGQTLLSLFGTPADGVVGGTQAEYLNQTTDKVLVSASNGALTSYYYDTSSGYWKRVGSAINRNNVPVSPSAGVFYYRIGTTDKALQFVGAVPSEQAQQTLPDRGASLVASYFPVDQTLDDMELQVLPDWRKLGDSGVTVQDADRVIFEASSGAVLSAYYDASAQRWKRQGSSLDLGTKVIPAGAAVLINRYGSGGQTTWTRGLPYDLNQ
ncbi:MAG: TIGR02597 family protein [Chthoniobacterales bacterium]